MCVDETMRGVAVQQGALKACTAAAADDALPRAARREAAHAAAKILVTTNPTLLSEPLRLAAVAPLLLLCRDVDASNLQQFEACLALTNLTSVGAPEQVTQRGGRALLFSIRYLTTHFSLKY